MRRGLSNHWFAWRKLSLYTGFIPAATTPRESLWAAGEAGRYGGDRPRLDRAGTGAAETTRSSGRNERIGQRKKAETFTRFVGTKKNPPDYEFP